MWWGKGFTEWTNVTASTPQFDGHYQPRLPGELGFYDLRVPEVRHQQADLARQHGIDGFVFYHYWFNGRRVLNRPLDDLRADESYDFPFALCWANEDWRRNWDGHSGELLLEQRYSHEDDVAHMEWLAEVFNDERYIRVDGKPLFLVYRPTLLPDMARTFENWREVARRNGVGEIFLAAVESDIAESLLNPKTVGLDAMIEFGVDWRNVGLKRPSNSALHCFDYANTAHRTLTKPKPGFRRFSGVGTGFDNSPRKKNGLVLESATPEIYEDWLARTIARDIERYPNDSEHLVFVNAWNEWAEGAVLEPCRRWGRAFLEAHKSGIQRGIGNDVATGPLAPDNFADVTVAIVTEGNPDALMSCLQSALAATSAQANVEFVVIDNASTDTTSLLLAELADTVRSHRLGIRHETLEARTLAQAMASTDLVLLLSPDIRMTEGWFLDTKQLLESQPTSSGLRLKIDGCTQEPGLAHPDRTCVLTSARRSRVYGLSAISQGSKVWATSEDAGSSAPSPVSV
jgi:hypothetical protein